MLSRARAIVGAGHPGDGPHRPDAAVGDDARRLQGAGTHGREGAASSYDDALALEAAGCFALVLEACRPPVAARITRRAHDPDDRDRRRRGLRRPGARLARPARPVRGHAPAVRQALRGPRRRDPRRRSTTYAGDVRSGAFPEEQHTYAMPEDELARFFEDASLRADRAAAREARAARTSAAAKRDASPERARPASTLRPSRTPITSSASAHTANAQSTAVEHVARVALVGAAAAEQVAAEGRDPQRPDDEERERERRRRSRRRAARAGSSPWLPSASHAPQRAAPPSQ